MAQTTSLVFNGGVIPSPSPVPAGSGKAKLLKIGKITVTEQEVQVTKKVICDPDSVTTVAPFMEVLTSARLAELISANSILVLDDGTVQYLMADATVVVEDGTSVCTSVNFLGLSLEDRAKALYPCTRITDELTLQQVLEVGEPVVTGFDLVKAYPEDTEAGTLIDKLEIEDNSTDPDWQPLLEVVPTDHKVAINEDNLREALLGINNSIDGIIETIDEMDVDSVPHAYLHSTLNQSAGDSVTTSTTINVFAQDALEGDCFEFEQTTTIDGTPFGYVWIEPGTYLINAAVTLQWVGNPRGTFVAKVGSVMGENFDFSQEQELKRQSTKVVTIPNRMKLAVNVTYDAGTPVMGFWIQSMQVVKLAGGMSQTTVAHGLSLEGNGSIEDPLDISEHGLQEAFDYAKDKEYFATKQEIAPLATQSALQAETVRATQRENEIEALFTLPTQEAVDAWLNAHPEATTTVQDHSLTGDKLVIGALNFVTPEMFGAVGDGVTDDTEAIQAAMDACASVLFSAKTYLVSPDDTDSHVCLRVNNNQKLNLNGATIKVATNSYNRYSIFNLNAIINSTVENVINDIVISCGTILGDRTTHTGSTGEHGHGISVGHAKNVILRDLVILDCWGDGICTGCFDFSTNPQSPSLQCERLIIEHCVIHDCRRQGISITCGFTIFVNACEIYNISGTNPQSGIDIEFNSSEHIENVTISNCYIHDCVRGLLSGGDPGLQNPRIYGLRIVNVTTDENIQLQTSSDLAIVENCRAKGIRVGRYCDSTSVSNSFFSKSVIESNAGNTVFQNVVFSNIELSDGLIDFSLDGADTGNRIERVEFINCKFVVARNMSVTTQRVFRIYQHVGELILLDCSFEDKTDLSQTFYSCGFIAYINTVDSLLVKRCSIKNLQGYAGNGALIRLSTDCQLIFADNDVILNATQYLVNINGSSTLKSYVVNNNITNPPYPIYRVPTDAIISLSIVSKGNNFFDSVNTTSHDITWLNDIISRVNAGATSARPSGADPGTLYFDSTLGKMICWNGSAWVNMDGSVL